ncbi:hypothetical protein [Natrinema sp. 74]|uniref:hypothetical protein n=1 Tax=Natrinema sp. 74 TaxID=3384159 RepID=UPI0038D4E076
MTLLPVDTDALEDVCRDIAHDNYGFLYVSEHKTDIRDGYEGAQTGMLNARSLSASDMRKALAEMAADEFLGFEKLRDGVFYVDPFGVKGNMNITRELTNLFGQRLVVTGETLRSRFSLAIDDIDFFVNELAERNYVRRITAGKRDYYTIGPALKEHADDVGLDARLEAEASNGKIAHSDLENVIDVAATSDVIRYLDREGYIVDLDGEYLVEESIDEYGRYLAERLEDSVETAFADSSHVLRSGEFERVVENAIDDRFDVLSSARSVRAEIIAAVETALYDRLGLEQGPEMVVATEPFDAVVEEQARRILDTVRAEYDVFASPSEFLERAEDDFTAVHVASDERVNEYVRTEVENRYELIVKEEEF